MLKKAFGIVLLGLLIFLGQKQGKVFFCDTEINLEQVLYESAADTIPLPPDSILQQKVTLAITAHIVRKKNGKGGIRESIVLNEVERLNKAFAGAGISFEVCNFNYINNERFYSLTKYDEARLITYNIENTINLYFVSKIVSPEEGNICGYTYYPTKKLDHVFLANNCVPGGTTLIHELGHFFGLYHTHELKFGSELVSGANCRKAGDLICDTPADPGLRSSLVSESCEFTGFVTDVFQTAYEPPVRNYMSYSRNSCRNNFTNYQLLKMRLNYHYFKTHFKTLQATFEVSDSIIVAGDSLTLQASGGIEYWWSTGDTTAVIRTAPDSSGTYSVNIVTDNGCNIFKQYAVEVIKGDFIETPEFVCAGEEGILKLNKTKEHLVYLLTDSANNITYSGYGNGETLHIPLPPLTESQTYNLTLANPETERYWKIPDDINIQVIPYLTNPDSTALIPTQVTMCEGGIRPINIPSSSPGTFYQLIKEEVALGEPTEGTGEDLVLFTDPATENATYHLRLYNSCEERVLRDIVRIEPSVSPDIDALTVDVSAQKVESGDSVVVTLENSDTTRSYQLLMNNIFVSKPVTGTGGELTFTTPPVRTSSDFCVVVYNAEGCRSAINYPIRIDVRNPEKEFHYDFSVANTLTYHLPEREKVLIQLYYLDGRLAHTLETDFQKAGNYRYDLNSFQLPLPPGSYMVKLRVGSDIRSKRIIYMR